MAIDTHSSEREMPSTQTSHKNFRNAILAAAVTFAALAGVSRATAAVPITGSATLEPPPFAAPCGAPNRALAGGAADFNGSASCHFGGSIANPKRDRNGNGFEVRAASNGRVTTFVRIAQR